MVNTMCCYFGSFLDNFEEIENERLNSRCAKQRSRPDIRAQKKPDDSRTRVRRSRQEPVPETTEKRPARHKDTMVPCWCISFQEQKSISNLAGFLTLLLKQPLKRAWNQITTWVDTRSKRQYNPNMEKVKPFSIHLSFFLKDCRL